MIEVLSPQEQEARINVESMVAFDGVSQYASAGVNQNVLQAVDINKSFSISVIVNPVQLSNNAVDRIVAMQKSNTGWMLYGFNSSNVNQIRIILRNGSSYIIWHTNNNTYPKNTTHIGFTFNSSSQTGQFFFNSIPVLTTKIENTPPVNIDYSLNQTLKFGNDDDNNAQFYYNGFLSHLAFFNRTLTQQEISYIHAQGGLLPASTHANCVAHYPMTQREGNTLFDVVEQYNYSKPAPLESWDDSGWVQADQVLSGDFTITFTNPTYAGSGINGYWQIAFSSVLWYGLASNHYTDRSNMVQQISQSRFSVIGNSDFVDALVGDVFEIKRVGTTFSLTNTRTGNVRSGTIASNANYIYVTAVGTLSVIPNLAIAGNELTYNGRRFNMSGTTNATLKKTTNLFPYHATLQNFTPDQHTGGSQLAYKEFYDKLDHRPLLQKFNGVNQEATAGLNPNVNNTIIGTSDWSISYFTKNRSFGAGQTMISNRGGSNCQFFVGIADNGQLFVRFNSSGISNENAIWFDYELDSLVFVTATYNSGSRLAKIYVNGKFLTSLTASTNYQSSSDISTVGLTFGRDAGIPNWTDGETSEFTVFNKLLTDQEAKELFEHLGNPQASLHENVVAHYVADQSNMQMTDIVEKYNYAKENIVRNISGSGWSGAAFGQLEGDFLISFKVGSVGNIAVGITDDNITSILSGGARIENGIRLTSTPEVFVSNNIMANLTAGAGSGAYAIGDVFEIERTGNTLYVRQNSVQIDTLPYSAVSANLGVNILASANIEDFYVDDIAPRMTLNISDTIDYRPAPIKQAYHAALQNFTATEDRLIERTSLLPPLRKALRFDGVNAQRGEVLNFTPTAEQGYTVFTAFALESDRNFQSNYEDFFLSARNGTPHFLIYGFPNSKNVYITTTGLVKWVTINDTSKINAVCITLVPQPNGSADITLYLNGRKIETYNSDSTRYYPFDQLGGNWIIAGDDTFSNRNLNGHIVSTGIAKGIATPRQVHEMWNNGLLMQPRKEWTNLDWQLLINFNHIIDNSGTYELENLGSAGGNAVLNGYTSTEIVSPEESRLSRLRSINFLKGIDNLITEGARIYENNTKFIQGSEVLSLGDSTNQFSFRMWTKPTIGQAGLNNQFFLHSQSTVGAIRAHRGAQIGLNRQDNRLIVELYETTNTRLMRLYPPDSSFPTISNIQNNFVGFDRMSNTGSECFLITNDARVLATSVNQQTASTVGNLQPADILAFADPQFGLSYDGSISACMIFTGAALTNTQNAWLYNSAKGNDPAMGQHIGIGISGRDTIGANGITTLLTRYWTFDNLYESVGNEYIREHITNNNLYGQLIGYLSGDQKIVNV